MAPAPRKPMPVTMLAAMRVRVNPGSMLMEKIVNSAEPTVIRMMVRKPAALSRYSRSAPTMPPTRTAIPSLIRFSMRMSSICWFYNKSFNSGIVVIGFLHTKPSQTYTVAFPPLRERPFNNAGALAGGGYVEAAITRFGRYSLWIIWITSSTYSTCCS